MLTYTIRRLILSVPVLLFIALIIFLLLQLAPGDPMAQVPLTGPPEVKEKMRLALGLGEPWWVRFPLWLKQFFWLEPRIYLEGAFGWDLGTAGETRLISYATRSPVMDIVIQRMPQTLWVVGTAYVVAIFIALSWRRDRPAALLFVPYLAWVCFATALNYQFLQLNPQADGGTPEGAVERVRI